MAAMAVLLWLAALVACAGDEEETLPPADSTPGSPVGAQSVLTTTSTPTAVPVPDDWLTYVDAEFGFSFPYPPRLASVQVASQPGLPGGESARFVELRDAAGERGLAVLVTPVGGLTVDQWVDEYTACGGDAGAEEEELVIAGEKALRCQVDQLNEPNPHYYLKWSTHIFTISGTVAGSKEGGSVRAPVLTAGEMVAILDGLSLPVPASERPEGT